jgi:O-antigen ligase
MRSQFVAPSEAFGRHPSATGAGLLEASLPNLLLILFLLYTFVGTSPLGEVSVEARAEGSPFDRLVIFALAALAATVVALRPRSSLRLAQRSWLIWLMLGWCGASLAWSDFPDLTLRRVVSLALVTLVCFAIGVGIDSLRRLHTILFWVLALVVVANLAVTQVRPDFAITDIGVRGFYTQKNQAGLVAMVVVLVAMCRMLKSPSLSKTALSLAVLGAAAVFLSISESKTSQALTLLAVPLLPMIMLLQRLGGAFAILVAGFAILFLGAVGLFAAGLGINPTGLIALNGDPTFTGRAEIWDFVKAEIGRRPWTGSGYGAFWDVGPVADPLLRAPPGTWLSQVKTGFINQAHNGYLDLWLQAGLPALVLGIFGLAQATLILLRGCFLRARQDGDHPALIMGFVIMIVFFLHNFTESSIWSRGQMLANLSLLLVFMAHRTALAQEEPTIP